MVCPWPTEAQQKTAQKQTLTQRATSRPLRPPWALTGQVAGRQLEGEVTAWHAPRFAHQDVLGVAAAEAQSHLQAAIAIAVPVR